MPDQETVSTETVKILVIDDDQGDFEMARSMIGQIDQRGVEYEVDWVPSFQEAVDAFRQNDFDFYIVDYFLEDGDGLDLVRMAREMGVREPIVMLTGRGSHEVDVEAMKAGASDYLVKGRIDPDVLERTIRYCRERARAQEALRASEERHRGMFDHLPIGLYRCSPDGDFMDANPALVRILGHPDPGLLRQRYAADLYVNPQDRRRFEALLEKYGVARGFETELERSDGSTIRIRNTARAHRGHDGSIQYLEGAVEDVTDLRTAERIQGSAARFRTVYEESRLAILLVDLDGLVMDGNPAFRRAFGYAADDLHGRPVADLLAPSHRKGFLEQTARMARGEIEESAGERRFLSGDDEILWARTVTSLVRDTEGEPDHVMLLLEEIAEAGPEESP